MCTLIVTIRTVLWYVMSLAGTLLILVACFTDRWLHRPSLQERLTDMEGTEGYTFFCISIILDDKIMSALIYMKIVYYRFCWNGKERHNLRFRWGDLWRSKRKYWIIREMHGTYFRMIGMHIYTQRWTLFFSCQKLIFLQKPEGAFFEGECVPNIDDIKTIYTEWDRNMYPHAWRGAILCFTLGLFVCVLTGGYYEIYDLRLKND